MAKNKTAHSSKNDSAISWETLSRLALMCWCIELKFT